MRKKHLLCRLPVLLLLVALTACRRDMTAPTAAPTETAEEAPSPTPEVSGTAKQDDGGTESDGRVVLYAVAAMLLAAAGAIALLVRKPHKKSKKKSRKK